MMDVLVRGIEPDTGRPTQLVTRFILSVLIQIYLSGSLLY